MASISDRTHDRQRGGGARDPGAPLSGRTLALFAGMVVTGSLTVGLITSAIASLVVPENQIGLRPYLVSSLPAVLMLFIAIVPALWSYWFWRRIFPGGNELLAPPFCSGRSSWRRGREPRHRSYLNSPSRTVDP